MDFLWKAKQKNVLQNKRKSFKLAFKKRKIMGFKIY